MKGRNGFKNAQNNAYLCIKDIVVHAVQWDDIVYMLLFCSPPRKTYQNNDFFIQVLMKENFPFNFCFDRSEINTRSNMPLMVLSVKLMYVYIVLLQIITFRAHRNSIDFLGYCAMIDFSAK